VESIMRRNLFNNQYGKKIILCYTYVSKSVSSHHRAKEDKTWQKMRRRVLIVKQISLWKQMQRRRTRYTVPIVK
jgi:hypothetical protein